MADGAMAALYDQNGQQRTRQALTTLLRSQCILNQLGSVLHKRGLEHLFARIGHFIHQHVGIQHAVRAQGEVVYRAALNRRSSTQVRRATSSPKGVLNNTDLSANLLA